VPSIVTDDFTIDLAAKRIGTATGEAEPAEADGDQGEGHGVSPQGVADRGSIALGMTSETGNVHDEVAQRVLAVEDGQTAGQARARLGDLGYDLCRAQPLRRRGHVSSSRSHSPVSRRDCQLCLGTRLARATSLRP